MRRDVIYVENEEIRRKENKCRGILLERYEKPQSQHGVKQNIASLAQISLRNMRNSLRVASSSSSILLTSLELSFRGSGSGATGRTSSCLLFWRI
ncbi:hypothetical protein E2C01_006935 [Portunus trituberculatus]|uniref:Uncharacterized protein n=1 Tax=Portunus trituberculatus TaxID=210409 RepID=A0A5B7CY43_PORTR|nr:hypothetical protein [Portunus trituberculatus]